MLTGQHQHTHGVWMNGVPLPVDAPSVAGLLHDEGYRTALIGKAHFEPFLDPFLRFNENRLSTLGTETVQERRFGGGTGPHRGFDHLEFATHGAAGWLHYARWLGTEHPEAVAGYYAVLDRDMEVNAEGFGDTGAPQVKHNPIERDWYHTDWVADRTIAYLDSVIPVVPSETTVIIAGVAVSVGEAQYPLWLVIVCGATGAFLGDNTAYQLGRWFAPRFERRAERKPKFAARLRRLVIRSLLPDVLVKGADWAEDAIVGAPEVRAAACPRRSTCSSTCQRGPKARRRTPTSGSA